MVKVRKIVPVAPTLKIELELTEREASDLLSMGQFIGGNPDNTSRGLIDKINQGLRGAGVVDSGRAVRAPGGGIYFAS